jgi:hypothetical protein
MGHLKVFGLRQKEWQVVILGAGMVTILCHKENMQKGKYANVQIAP